MVQSRSARLRMTVMGQNSSQSISADLDQTERTAKSKGKMRKSRTGNKQSEMEHYPIDEEEESARALLLMREGPVHDSSAPYYQDDLAASQQLIAENYPTHLSEPASGDHRSGKSNRKSRSNSFILTGGGGKLDGFEYPRLPSTPPRQIVHSSPPPYRPIISQSTHALDELSTDDEAIAPYMQEYGGNNGSADQLAGLEDNADGFSQQPPQISDRESYGITEHSTHNLPLQASAKQKKRKRGRASMSDEAYSQRQPLENMEGQHILHPKLGDFDQSYEDDLHANAHERNEDNMPIDPELHSMSALPPLVDLNQLGNDSENTGQKKTQKRKQNGSVPSSKRRRKEEASNASNSRVPYYSPYALDHLQDRALPGFEDSHKKISPELGSPYMENIANQGLGHLNEPASPGPSTQRKKKGSSSKAISNGKLNGDEEPKSSIKAISKGGGQWTAGEAEKLDNFRNSYCDANDISGEQFNTYIQSTIRDNVEAKSLFDELHEVVPYRPRISVQKFCRRRYHNFPARGTWTAEEDEVLKQAVIAKPNQWKAIGEMLDRMGEDCRDRYRNYLLNSENRNREAWSNEEVQSLCKAILESRQAMRDERRQSKIKKYEDDALDSDSDSDQEDQDMKIVNWQNISDRMDGIRSRLQCRLKWVQLKAWEQKNFVQSAIDAKGFEGRKSAKTKNPWRMKRALKKVANMRTGDQYALVQAILHSGASTEDNIPWKTIGDADFQMIWNSIDKKAAWATLKQTFPGPHSADYRTIAKGLCKRLLTDYRDELNERWDPGVDGDVSVKKRGGKTASRRQQGDNEEETSTGKTRIEGRARPSQDQRKSSKSSELFCGSDQEEVADSADEPQGRNRHDGLSGSNSAEINLEASMQEAAATGNEQQREYGDEDDADSLFNEQSSNVEDQPMVDKDVCQDLARRVQLLRQAWAS